MDMSRIRAFLYIGLFFLGLSLYSLWVKEHPMPQKSVAQSNSPSLSMTEQDNLPSAPYADPAFLKSNAPVAQAADTSRYITIENDVLRLKISLKGGDIIYAELKQYPRQLKSDQGFVLLDRSEDRHYYVQTGLLGEEGPDSYRTGRGIYSASQSVYHLDTDTDTLEVPLTWRDEQGLLVIKRFRLYKGQYRVDIEHSITNHKDVAWQGNLYGQIARRPLAHEKKGGFLSWSMPTYEGGALYTQDKPFKKVPYDKFDKTLKNNMQGGWAAMVEHYFLSAWLPSKNDNQQYFTRTNQQGEYVIGSIGPQLQVENQQSATVHASVYLGPEVAEVLDKIAPGLGLTVDYGFLWPISAFLFWVLKHIHQFVGNWGWSIILLTVLIKLAFYRLSAASYRSMGNLRRLQPRIEQLKQSYGEDKMAFSQKMMELYRKEKVNPLGGCLPILIQIPVFIAFYYMLLESVDLRLAPFAFWIQDLSSKDPFYVLPIIMGITMLLQQKMNPTPPDPIQAKMMMLMPFIFTVLFLQFPAGLVLYWVVNNLLSILQQWMILRKLEQS